jgi:hypothetical protein
MRNIILDLCGGTGAWSKPYKEAGYNVQLITLPEHSVLQVEFGDYAMDFKDLTSPNPHSTTCVLYKDITGILAAPPCTEFSIAKNTRDRDLAAGMITVEACLKIIWEASKHTVIDFWALENPRGLLRRFLGIPPYSFAQWQFGGKRVKQTDIWGKFNIPLPTHKIKPPCRTGKTAERTHAADWTMPEYPPEYESYMSQFNYDDRRAAARAITPAGFAEAFFKANRPKIIT